ncbi:MAG: T9SS type A sorting domain-containing protein [Bacteroidetes bacterium]|nr:T9SS type A sorting domain-containing protein [Bacteroidota bacterium]
MKKFTHIAVVLLMAMFSQRALAQSCSLTASYSYSINVSEVTFSNTSVGTTSNAICNWYFGDGTSDTTVSSIAEHRYKSGVYTTTLMIMQLLNGQWCSSSAAQTFSVNPCILSAHLSHTLNTAGTASFVSISTGTNANTVYYWDFGDGHHATNPEPLHTYLSAGLHYVKLKITDTDNAACQDSLMRAVNVTFANITTGVEELNDESIELSVYPNPVSEMLNVESPLTPKGGTIKIFDVLGNLVLEHTITPPLEGKGEAIDLRELKSGIYFLNIQSDNKRFTKKIIVNKN